MKKVVILGSTGSVGVQAIDVIRSHPGEFEVIGISGHSNKVLLEKQTKEFKPKHVVVADSRDAEASLMALACDKEADLIVNAISGYAGFMPTYATCRAGKKVVLANKESLVLAGELIMKIVHETGAQILPVDSEMSAIWQALLPHGNNVEKIILTASGGPFWGFSRDKLEKVTAENATNHPTWKMGKRISVDSATLMNKGFEIIEAHWLFGVPLSKIEVSIHRQSAVHSFVQFTDGNVIAAMGATDMRIPISYALFYPERIRNSLPRLNFANLKLTFEKPDFSLFEGPRLAREALDQGGIMPAVLCIADEIAVTEFLAGKISFLEIYSLIKRATSQIKNESLSLAALADLPDKIRSLIT